MLINREKKIQVLILVVSFIFVAALYYGIAPYHDGYFLRNLSLSPGGSQFSYWWDIFTGPNHGGQYRPISFFTTFYIFSSLFGPGTTSYILLGSLLFSISNFHLYKLMRERQFDTLTSIFAAALFLLHPTHVHISEITFVVKYYFPLVVLIWGARVFQDPQSNSRRFFLLTCLFILALLCHEGSLFFPLVWLLFQTDPLHVRKISLVTFIPSLIYLIVRLFIFHVPHLGFMKVDYLQLPKGVIYSINYFFSFGWLDPTNLSYSFFAFLLVLLSFKSYKEGIKATYPLFMFTFLTAPFSVLANHFFPERAVWMSFPVTIFYVNCFHQKNTRYLLIPLLILSLIKTLETRDSFFLQANDLQHKLTKDITYIEGKIKDVDVNDLVDVRFKHFEYMYAYKTILPELASRNPHREFFITFNQEETPPDLKSFYHYVDDGYYYEYEVETGEIVDAFNQSKKMKFVPRIEHVHLIHME